MNSSELRKKKTEWMNNEKKKSQNFDMSTLVQCCWWSSKIATVKKKNYERNLIELSMKLTHFEGSPFHFFFLQFFCASTAPVPIHRNHLIILMNLWRVRKSLDAIWNGFPFRGNACDSTVKVNTQPKKNDCVQAHLNGFFFNSLRKWPMCFVFI